MLPPQPRLRPAQAPRRSASMRRPLGLSRRRPPSEERQMRALLAAVVERGASPPGRSARRVAAVLKLLAQGDGAQRVAEDLLAGGHASSRRRWRRSRSRRSWGPDCFSNFI
jgi:hypothetical protein